MRYVKYADSKGVAEVVRIGARCRKIPTLISPGLRGVVVDAVDEVDEVDEIDAVSDAAVASPRNEFACRVNVYIEILGSKRLARLAVDPAARSDCIV